jgi:hypothetical protein
MHNRNCCAPLPTKLRNAHIKLREAMDTAYSFVRKSLRAYTAFPAQ